MLNNLRRKRVQRLDIESRDEFNGIWWFKDLLVYGVQYSNLGNQRYSKKKKKQSFDHYRLKRHLIPYCRANDEIYNMILCPSGSFWKESNNTQDSNPLEEMKIEKPFLLGETEITHEFYYSVVNQNPNWYGYNPKNPVAQVSWYDALRFCNRLSDMFGLEHYYVIGNGQNIFLDGYGNKETHYPVKTNGNSKGFRLPTEWEWKYAAKAGRDLKYSGSNNADEVGWHNGNSDKTTHPVKERNPNAWGFYDMSGNVWEWCENTYNLEDKSISAARVVLGGGWATSIENFLVRRFSSPIGYSSEIGFRVCRYL